MRVESYTEHAIKVRSSIDITYCKQNIHVFDTEIIILSAKSQEIEFV